MTRTVKLQHKNKNLVYFCKNCQESPNVHMWPLKPAKESTHMQSVTRSSNTSVEPASDKNCQAIRCYKKNNLVCSDKTCQDYQCVNMQPVKPETSSIMWLPKPAVPNQYKRLCNDKNCQSTRCYKISEYIKYDKNCQSTRCFSFKKKCPVRPVCNDKNCQSANVT